MNTITPFLWFDGNLEEAIAFYQSIFKSSSVEQVTRYTKAGPGPEGSVMTAAFTLNGQRFAALNGGPQYKFTEAVSFFIECQTQDEIDHYWEKLSQDAQTIACGWLKDKFGLSWQVAPTILLKYLGDSDTVKVERVMRAMMQMIKIDIKGIEDAYKG